MAKYERNLRGNQLARQILQLNGHQRDVAFVFFHPVWCFMMLSATLSGFIPILAQVGVFGLLGALFELSVWLGYYIRTKRVTAYPGLRAWLSIQTRRRLMPLGRSAGSLSKPR